MSIEFVIFSILGLMCLSVNLAATWLRRCKVDEWNSMVCTYLMVFSGAGALFCLFTSVIFYFTGQPFWRIWKESIVSGEVWIFLYIGLVLTAVSIYYAKFIRIMESKERLVWGLVFGLLALSFFVNAGFHACMGKSFMEFF